MGLENEVDDPLRHPVGGTEVQTGNCNEADDNGSSLRNLRAIGPLHALKLGPAGAQKSDGARRKRLAALTRSGRGGFLAECLDGAGSVTTAARAAATAGSDRGELGYLRQRASLAGAAGPRLELLAGLGLSWHAAGATNERGVELVDLARVLECTR